MNKTLTTHVKERQENLQSKQGNLQSKQVRMEQLTEEQQKQVKKMSTARIRQRLIKAGFTEVGLEGLSREELMNTLTEHIIKQELSSNEEDEEEGAVGGAKVKKPPGQTVELDPLPTFVNPPMTMESMMQMMMMMMMMMRQDEERRRQDEEKRRREEKREQEE